MSVTLPLYDKARAAIQERGFDTDIQTKIALFVGAARTVNATIMTAFEMQPQLSVATPFVHGQFFRELEFASLLWRVTRWSPNAMLYAQGAQVVSPLWREWWQLLADASPPNAARVAYGGLALGHALLARVRLTPVFAPGVDELDPFVVALRRIEQEAGRMIQAQIRLLKDGIGELDARECARIIDAKQTAVDDAFEGFLEWIAGGAAGAAAWRSGPAASPVDQLPPFFDGYAWLLRSLARPMAMESVS